VVAMDGDNVDVKCLRSEGTISRFSWPNIDDDNTVLINDIVRVLPHPFSERRGVIFSPKTFANCEKLK